MEGEVTVRDVMTREYVGVSESDTVLGAVKLMCEDDAGCVVVLRGSDPVGILTESDVLALVADERDPDDATVSSVMSAPVVSVHADRALSDAASTMSREQIRRLAVTNDDELVGVLSERDVIAASASLSGVPSIGEGSLGAVGNAGVGADPATAAPSSGEPMDDDAMGEETVGPGADEADQYEYSDRSICEVCGSLSRELSNVNGQLVCADCRTV